MRGDWIYDWAKVEMEYRAGPTPAVAPPRRPSKLWQALRAGLFPGRRPHRDSATISANSVISGDRRVATHATHTSFGGRSSTGTCATPGRV